MCVCVCVHAEHCYIAEFVGLFLGTECAAVNNGRAGYEHYGSQQSAEAHVTACHQVTYSQTC